MAKRVRFGTALIVIGFLILGYAIYNGFSPIDIVDSAERVYGPNVISPASAYFFVIVFWAGGILGLLGKLPDSWFGG